SRKLEAADGIRPPGASDDVQVGIERAGRQDDVDGALVRVDGADEPTRAFDACLLEDFLLRRVALDVQAALRAYALERLVGLVDDHVGHLVRLELGHDLSADTAVATDDEMVAQRIEVSLQLALSPIPAESIVRQRLREDAEAVQHRADADHYEARGEQPARGALRVHLGVADGAD